MKTDGEGKEKESVVCLLGFGYACMCAGVWWMESGSTASSNPHDKCPILFEASAGPERPRQLALRAILMLVFLPVVKVGLVRHG